MKKIIDIEKNKIVKASFIKDLLIEFEVDDILDNWEDFKCGHLDIKSKCEFIKKINNMSIEKVIYNLNTFWACAYELVEK